MRPLTQFLFPRDITNLTGFNRTGVLCIVLCFALGIANIFHFTKPILIIFSVICLYVGTLHLRAIFVSLHADLILVHRVSSFVLVFVEIPLLMRICPTSSKFDAFIRRFTTNYMRAAMYAIMSVIQWLSLIRAATSLLVAAVVLLIAACFYTLAGIKGQGFIGSKTLGGQGIAQMIV